MVNINIGSNIVIAVALEVDIVDFAFNFSNYSIIGKQRAVERDIGTNIAEHVGLINDCSKSQVTGYNMTVNTFLIAIVQHCIKVDVANSRGNLSFGGYISQVARSHCIEFNVVGPLQQFLHSRWQCSKSLRYCHRIAGMSIQVNILDIIL